MDKEEKAYQVRTDLAVEAKDMYVENEEKQESDLKGVTIKERTKKDIKITYVDINDVGAKNLGKEAGSYTTIYADGDKRQDTASHENAAKILAAEIEKMI